jgi:hypothetical protein
VFVAMVGGDGGVKNILIRNSQENKGRAQKQETITRIKIY